jgi:hypothetical protein
MNVSATRNEAFRHADLDGRPRAESTLPQLSFDRTEDDPPRRRSFPALPAPGIHQTLMPASQRQRCQQGISS